MTQDFISSGVGPTLPFSALFEALSESSILLQNDAPNYTILAASPGYIAMIGIANDNLIGKGMFEAFPPNPNDPSDTGSNDVKASFDMVRLHKKPHQLPVQRYDVAGEDGTLVERYWRASNKPVFASDGEVAYIIHTAEDITREVKADEMEEKMKGMEQAYNLFNQTPLPVCFLKGSDLVIEMANAPILQLWGKGTEVIGLPLQLALPEVKGQGDLEMINEVRVSGVAKQIYESPVSLIRNGKKEVAYINYFYQPYYEKDKKDAVGVLSIGSDVTDKVLARKQQEESLKELRFVMDVMPQMVWLTRPDGYHYFYNKQWYDYTGLALGETEGEGWNEVFHPDDRERSWKAWRHSLATGDPYQIEYRCRRHDGEYRWFLGRALPLKDEKGTILKWFGTCTDIHDQITEAQLLEQKVEQRTAELQVAIHELKRSNENLEEFAYAASHDLKEPIRKIHIFADRLKGVLQGKLDKETNFYFERLETSATRMSTLIDDLLMYSHINRGASHLETVDLHHTLSLVEEDLELAIKDKGATISVELLPTIRGHKRQLQQLFENLIANALKYSKPDKAPEVTITAQLVHGKNTTLQISGEDGDKLYHLIEVKDNGIGFDPGDADRIFNVFTRLHGNAEYKGTGVGLSIARKVVENHHGYIWAESTSGEGARFKVLLPAE